MFGDSNIFNSFKIKNLVFLIFAFLVIASLFGLGVWQINRLKWKKELINKISQISTISPIHISDFSNISDKLFFKKIIISGTIEPNFNIYRYRHQNNKSSYELFNILKLSSNHKILIKRNFLLEEPHYNHDKEVKITIIAIVLKPQKQSSFTINNNFINNLIFNIDIPSMNKYYKQNIEEKFYLQQLNDNDDISKDILVNIPNQHKLYAITWFSLCLIIIIMTIFNAKHFFK